MKKYLSAASLVAVFPGGMECADAQGFTIGGRVTCDGATGTVVRTEPRPAREEPFPIVRLEGADADLRLV